MAACPNSSGYAASEAVKVFNFSNTPFEVSLKYLVVRIKFKGGGMFSPQIFFLTGNLASKFVSVTT